MYGRGGGARGRVGRRCPTNVDNSRTIVYYAFNRCGLGLLGLFLCRLLYLFSFSSSAATARKRLK